MLGWLGLSLCAACASDSAAVPDRHRAVAEQCDDYRAGGSLPYVDSTAPSCMTDSDCEALESDCGPNCRMTCSESDGVRGCTRSRGECVRDSDCTAGANGRCDNNREWWSCSYDECFDDSACTTGGPCACGGRYGSDGPNVCMAGNCQTDADCGDAGYCSPTQGVCGSYGGIIGFYCRTPTDTCVNDSECADPTRGGGYCMYTPELGHWACGYGQCVG